MFKIIAYKTGEGWTARGFASTPEMAAKHLLKTGQAETVFAFEKGQDLGQKFGYDLRGGFWVLPASRSYEQGIRNWTIRAKGIVQAALAA